MEPDILNGTAPNFYTTLALVYHPSLSSLRSATNVLAGKLAAVYESEDNFWAVYYEKRSWHVLQMGFRAD